MTRYGARGALYKSEMQVSDCRSLRSYVGTSHPLLSSVLNFSPFQTPIPRSGLERSTPRENREETPLHLSLPFRPEPQPRLSILPFTSF